MTGQGRAPRQAIVDWLLDSDPSIRWQVMQDLTDSSPEAVALERARVATEGWGARLLSLQSSDGNWGGGPFVYRSWASTMETLMLLRDMGLDPASLQARAAIDRVREKSEWGKYHGHSPFFEGESEPCINGRVLACGAYFGEPSVRLVERLVGEQMEDGGWNCDAPPSTRSSFNSTICVLEGLLAFEKATGTEGAVRQARLRGEEYLMARGLFKSLSTGEAIGLDRKSHCDWREFSYPTRWHYDVLWGLDYLRRAGAEADARVADAVELVESKCQADGRWHQDVVYEGTVHFEMEGGPGTPSRWVTLRALRALDWYAASRDATT